MPRITTSLATVALTCAGAAQAAPVLEIRGAAARVVVVPQNRSTISVFLVRANKRLPLSISHYGAKVTVTGDIGRKSRGCLINGGGQGARILGRGAFAYADLPQLVILTPMTVKISAGDAVFGTVGRSAAVDLTNSGCGDWTLANVSGPIRLNQFGSGHAWVGDVGGADLNVADAGKIDLRRVRSGVRAVSSGSGDVRAVLVNGPLNLRIAGSGDIRVTGGQVSALTVAIAGSGAVLFGGVARHLDASVAGPGVVTVAKVTGEVKQHVFGAGAVHVGP